MFLIVTGATIGLLSFFFALYNLYNAVKGVNNLIEPKNTFTRHILAIAGVIVGCVLLNAGLVMELVKFFSI